MTLPPAGWHPNPENNQELRYWDGSQWTEHTAPAAPTNDEPVQVKTEDVPQPVQSELTLEEQISQIISKPQPESSFFSRKETLEQLFHENSVFRAWAAEIGIADRERFKSEAEESLNQLNETRKRVAADLENLQVQNTAELEKLNKGHSKEIDKLEKEKAKLEQEVYEIKQELVESREEQILQEAGIYNFHSELESSLDYQVRILETKERIKEWVKSGSAVQGASGWTVNGSAKQGQKMVKEFSKLMLRAYNAEADDAVRTVKPHTLTNKIERLTKTVATISKLGATMGIRVADDYNRVRVYELQMKADYLAKVEQEKEAEREEKERLREEAKLLR